MIDMDPMAPYALEKIYTNTMYYSSHFE
jgi:hypothetical protein